MSIKLLTHLLDAIFPSRPRGDDDEAFMRAEDLQHHRNLLQEAICNHDRAGSGPYLWCYICTNEGLQPDRGDIKSDEPGEMADDAECGQAQVDAQSTPLAPGSAASSKGLCVHFCGSGKHELIHGRADDRTCDEFQADFMMGLFICGDCAWGDSGGLSGTVEGIIKRR